MGELLVIVGDTMLDRDIDGAVGRICPDAPVPVLDEESATDRPGGAGLAALLATADGYEVALVTALADDAAGARLGELLTAANVRLYPLPLAGATPEKIRLHAHGQVLLRLDRGGAASGPTGDPPEPALAILRQSSGILVSDYGRGMARLPAVRAALADCTAPVVWDPHPAGPAPVPGVRLATPNDAEVRHLTGDRGGGSRLSAASRGGHQLRRMWRADAVAVTMGAHGAVLCHAGPTPLAVPATSADGDTCGAGDQFAVAAATALGDGALVSEATQHAVARATTYVAGGGAAAALNRLPGRPSPHRTGAEPWIGAEPHRTGDEATGRLIAGVRARGGTVVATGGCFDLLHAGHLATLQAARQLGDCLVVCLNSDTSVAGLKGPHRPLTPQDDRRRLLAALGCVDAVVIFDEPTPDAVLSWLRPDVWVKGGDYADGGPDLPEANLVRRWGGQTVIVPYLDGRSTTNVITAARTAHHRLAGRLEGAA
jgi:rfaE bifunctional protein nucleotidyltransferase chain/domain